MIGKKLLSKYDSIEKQGGERSTVVKLIIDVDDTEALATSKETEIGEIDSGLASAIDDITT